MAIDRAAIRAAIASLGKPGLATKRACGRDAVIKAIRTLRDNSAAQRVRVYASAGFVPNSYKWRCSIQYIEATRTDDGWCRITTGWTDAKRPFGQGRLVIVR